MIQQSKRACGHVIAFQFILFLSATAVRADLTVIWSSPTNGEVLPPPPIDVTILQVLSEPVDTATFFPQEVSLRDSLGTTYSPFLANFDATGTILEVHYLNLTVPGKYEYMLDGGSSLKAIGLHPGDIMSAPFELTFFIGTSNPVPEPATLLLLGTGLLGIWNIRRKKLPC